MSLPSSEFLKFRFEVPFQLGCPHVLEAARWSLVFSVMFTGVTIPVYCAKNNDHHKYMPSLQIDKRTGNRIFNAYTRHGDVYCDAKGCKCQAGKRKGNGKRPPRSDKKMTWAVLKFVLETLRTRPSMTLRA